MLYSRNRTNNEVHHKVCFYGKITVLEKMFHLLELTNKRNSSVYNEVGHNAEKTEKLGQVILNCS